MLIVFVKPNIGACRISDVTQILLLSMKECIYFQRVSSPTRAVVHKGTWVSGRFGLVQRGQKQCPFSPKTCQILEYGDGNIAEWLLMNCVLTDL